MFPKVKICGMILGTSLEFGQHQNMRKEDKYTKVLLWAYAKQETGFTWEELKQSCSLSDSEERWVKKIFNTTNDADRKFVEHFRNDDNVAPNVHYYSLNEKGIAAALAALKAKRSDITNLIAISVSVISLLTAAISLGVAIWTGALTRDAVQLATQPQIDFYLQSTGTNTDEYIFGIENNGTIPITNIFAEYAQVSIYKTGCLPDSIDVTCGGFGSSMDIFFDQTVSIPILQPSESKEARIFMGDMGDTKDFVHALSITLSYSREIDKQRNTIPIVYFFRGEKIYTLDAIKDIPSMQPYLAAFRQLSAKTTLGNQKIYWK